MKASENLEYAFSRLACGCSNHGCVVRPQVFAQMGNYEACQCIQQAREAIKLALPEVKALEAGRDSK